MNKIILIGGAPALGKSFIARKLSEELKLPWISTDLIRGMMTKIGRKEDFPKIFYFADKGLTAESYLSSHTPQQVVDDQNAESIEVWKGVKALIEMDYVWKDFIIEGVAVLPELVKQIDTSKHEVKPIFLIDEDEKRVRDVIFNRGLWDDAKTYSDEIKEVEVEWVKLFNRYIESEAEKHGYNVYKIGDREEFIKNLTSELQE